MKQDPYEKWDEYNLSLVDHILYILEGWKNEFVDALDRLAHWLFDE